jgi:hypothetical protein
VTAGGGRDWEAVVALAMLPVGVALGLLSALAMAGLLAAALIWTVIAVIFHPPWAWLLVVGWFWAAGLAMAWCAVTAIEATGGLDWRMGSRVLAAWGLTALAWPPLWLGR